MSEDFTSRIDSLRVEMSAQGYSVDQIHQRIVSENIKNRYGREFDRLIRPGWRVRSDTITMNNFGLRASEKKMLGLRGIIVRHVPVYPEESKILGISERRKDGELHHITVVIPDQQPEEYGEIARLIGNEDQWKKAPAEIFFSKLAVAIYGHRGEEVSKLRQKLNELLETDKDYQSGNKELLVLYGHGGKAVDQKGTAKKGWGDEKAEINAEFLDYSLHFLAKKDRFVAVLDSTCSPEEDDIQHLSSAPIAYFGSYVNVNGITEDKKSFAVINGVIINSE